ncbi:hypothetical protein P4H27_26065 [Paenibacillus taichungensis]|uniref:hypothetical protein n=1 Tax=Paenibacillus taichungensis TaxID=484184 RepID=UPI002DB649FB|nr:hypothetical protein [Paenibacillus taichungensis]MEC0110440.1 hypothetical protein [Paenibacillus taichungensis]MEC0200116.1 hypothetical protein [Paenibacillus taichungensis]
MTEERLQEIRAMVNTGFIPAPGNATVAQLLEYSDSLDADNERLHEENQSLRRSLTSEAVKDANYNVEIVRLHKELEEATNLIGQQAMEMIRLQNLANKQAKEVDALKHSAVIVLSSHKYMEEELIKAQKETEHLRNTLETAQFQLSIKRTLHERRGCDCRSLAVGQEGEGNQDANGEA